MNKSDYLAFDRVGSVRRVDDDGRLHVSRSNFTRVQVAPYRGDEIPDWEKRGLNPERIYYAYRPPEELAKPATVRSVEGIPIQLRHNLDFPDAPAKKTRVGSTGDRAHFEFPYLANSLHIHDKKAIDLIESGDMRELSLCYHYDPDFTSGKTDEGKKYDFIMRNIRGQHLALVEEGRAGASCCVADSAEKVKTAKSPPESSGVFNTPNGAEISTKGSNMNDYEDFKEKAKAKGLSFESPDELLELLSLGAKAKAEQAEAKDDETDDIEENNDTDEFTESEEHDPRENDEPTEDEENAEDNDGEDAPTEPGEGEAEDNEEESEEGEADKLEKFLDSLGGESADVPEEVKNGLRVVAVLGGCNPEKVKKFVGSLVAEDEDEKEKEGEASLASDSLKSLTKKLEKKLANKAQAIEECRPYLGRVKLSAFDSAGHVYLAAIDQMGKRVKGVTPQNARVVFEAIQSEKRAQRRAMANDEKSAKTDALFNILNKVKVNNR